MVGPRGCLRDDSSKTAAPIHGAAVFDESRRSAPLRGLPDVPRIAPPRLAHLYRWLPATLFAAAALMAATAASNACAQDGGDVLRIGYQKAGLLAVVKAQGALDAKLKPLGY